MLLGAERLLEGWGFGWMTPDFGAVLLLDGLSGFRVVLDWLSGAGGSLDGWPFVLAEGPARAAGAWESSISSPFMVSYRCLALVSQTRIVVLSCDGHVRPACAVQKGSGRPEAD